MSKARDLANAGTALGAVTATELAFVDGVTSAIQTQIDAKEATLPSQTGNSGKYLTTNGTAKSWGTVSQYALPTQTGNSGKFLTTNGTAESWATVTVPLTWTQRLIHGDGSINTIAYNGSNLYVAAGSSGSLYSSPDGVTWTSRTSGFSSDSILKVAYGNGLWVAVGDSGKISTSTDGITWTARTANMAASTIYDVIYANSIWVAVGSAGGTSNTGGITYSTDGITWTRKSQSITVGSTYIAVVYNGSNFIVFSSGISTNNYLYASTPSGTWTAANDGTTGGATNAFYDGTRVLKVVSNSGLVWYSTSATIGTMTNITGAVLPSSNAYNYYYNGAIYGASAFITSVSTTPATGNYASRNASFLSPTTRSTPNDATTIQADLGTIFVGSVGYIVAGNRNLFTSF
jgi:hypothetical protein